MILYQHQQRRHFLYQDHCYDDVLPHHHLSEIEDQNVLRTPYKNNGLGLTTVSNLTPGGGLLKYGKHFAMTIKSI